MPPRRTRLGSGVRLWMRLEGFNNNFESSEVTQVLVMTAVCVACAWLLTPVSGFLEDQILQVWLQV